MSAVLASRPRVEPMQLRDLDEVIDASRAAGVTRWINVGFDARHWRSTLALAERIDGLSAMFGLHPGSVDDWSAALFDRLGHHATRHRPVAIGETVSAVARAMARPVVVEPTWATTSTAAAAGTSRPLSTNSTAGSRPPLGTVPPPATATRRSTVE